MGMAPIGARFLILGAAQLGDGRRSISYGFRIIDDEACARLQQEGMPAWLARLYASRGVKTAQEVRPHLSELLHYRTMRNIDATARRIARAIEEGETIVVVGDYDADGATATAAAILGLRMLGAREPRFVVPDRFKHGYGLSAEVARLAAEHRPSLLITVDNGIGAFSGVEEARRLGMDVIITDHHLAGDRLPDTPWIVNPNQPGCVFAGKHTAGVGVLFYVLLATRSLLMTAGRWTQAQKPRLESLLDLVALGTVADVVQLDANNRRLVAAGLARIRNGQSRALVRHLFDLSRRTTAYATASDLGFYVGPRINAAGRMVDMTLGIQGLIADGERAAEIAQALDDINRERKETQKQMELQAAALLDEIGGLSAPAGLVLYRPEWHEGVIGLVASRVKEKYWRPTIVLCDDQDGHLKGSGRSIVGLHLRDALDWIDRKLPGSILKFGGHAMAAGLTLRREALEAFRNAFVDVCARWLSPQALERQLLLDTPAAWSEIDFAAASTLESLVWGHGFEEPIFGSSLPIVRQEILKDAHLRFEVDAGGGRRLKGICFGRTAPIEPGHMVAWRLMAERWNGYENATIRVEQVFD